jgi:hypothetical protein
MSRHDPTSHGTELGLFHVRLTLFETEPTISNTDSVTLPDGRYERVSHEKAKKVLHRRL